MKLDIGTANFNEEEGWIGLDIEPAEFYEGNAKLCHARRYDTSIVADATHLPFKNKSFEEVKNLCGALCDADKKDIEPQLKEMQRVLKGRGTVLFGQCDANYKSLMRRVARGLFMDVEDISEDHSSPGEPEEKDVRFKAKRR